MTDAYVIEVDEDAVGLVVRESGGASRRQGYRFYASLKGYQSLEGRLFSNPESARRSAKAVSRRRRQSSSLLADQDADIAGYCSRAPFAGIAPIDLATTC
jgi:hypothetical protein